MRKREGARDREGQKEIESLREGGREREREREKIYNVGGFFAKNPFSFSRESSDLSPNVGF